MSDELEKAWKNADGWESGTCRHRDEAHTFCTRCVNLALRRRTREAWNNGRNAGLEEAAKMVFKGTATCGYYSMGPNAISEAILSIKTPADRK